MVCAAATAPLTLKRGIDWTTGPAAAAPTPASACSTRAGWMERERVCRAQGVEGRAETCTVKLPTACLRKKPRVCQRSPEISSGGVQTLQRPPACEATTGLTRPAQEWLFNRRCRPILSAYSWSSATKASLLPTLTGQDLTQTRVSLILQRV